MFDNPYFLLKVIGILAGVAFIIYRFQLFSTIISGYTNWKKDKEKYEIDKLKYSLLTDELNEIKNKEENLNNSFSGVVIFHLLKLVDSKDKIVIYFSITGGTVSNIEIKSEDLDSITIEPKAFIANNSGGYINFIKNNSAIDEATFEIHYDDERKTRHSKKYLISFSEKKLKEL